MSASLHYPGGKYGKVLNIRGFGVNICKSLGFMYVNCYVVMYA